MLQGITVLVPFTKTVEVQVAVLPEASVAVRVTVTLVLPDAQLTLEGDTVKETVPGQLSEPVAFTVAGVI
jgi:hypothetical protein